MGIFRWRFFKHYGTLLWQYQLKMLDVLREAKKENRLKQTIKWILLDGGMAYLQFLNRFQQPNPVRGPTYLKGLNHTLFKKLAEQSKHLHGLLNDGEYSYSILIPVYKPNPNFFKQMLEAALNQSAPNFEVLIGYDGPQPDEVYQIYNNILSTHPEATKLLKVFEFDRSTNNGGISSTTNQLAAKASGKYLLLADHDDWIRPDLLYRYEQNLRSHPNPHNTVLYCNEFKIDELNRPIYHSFIQKPFVPELPYLFANTICHCLLVPAALFAKIGGMRSVCDGAQDFDFCLRAYSDGATFRNIPIYLYAWRVHAQSTALNANIKDYATPAGIRALEDFCIHQKLDWKITKGMRPTWYRAIPQIKEKPCVHVVMLYKDLKEMTLKAAKTIFHQKNVDVYLSCVDNNSADKTIAENLTTMGAEVLSIDEAFNFSRLNNLAVERSKAPAHFNSVLFINNDVELDENALYEMARWLDQPAIGCVGARLHYPDGRLQHGGVLLQQRAPHDELIWIHVDGGQLEENMALGALTRVCDAVTGACLLMKKSIFQKICGFDAINYPIAYSDTDLCLRLRKIGLFSLYTPFATGVHFESATRKFNSIEDHEQSRWLAESLGRV